MAVINRMLLLAILAVGNVTAQDSDRIDTKKKGSEVFGHEHKGKLVTEKTLKYGVLHIPLNNPTNDPLGRIIPSALPGNIRELTKEVIILPELQRLRDCTVKMLFLEQGYIDNKSNEYRMSGVFLGYEANFGTEHLIRYMYSFGSEELEFTRLVLKELLEQQESRSGKSEEARE